MLAFEPLPSAAFTAGRPLLERRLAGHMQDVERYAKELRRERGDSPHLSPTHPSARGAECVG